MKKKRIGLGSQAGDFISLGDISILLGLPPLLVIAWLSPPAVVRRFARLAAPLATPFVYAGGKTFAQQIAERIGDDVSAARVAKEVLAAEVERILLYLREHRSAQPPLAVAVHGREHIDAALARGSGAILWDSNFAFAGLLTKRSLAGQGYRVSHLSHPRHGFSSPTVVGVRFLNRLITAAEERYVRERVVLSSSGAAGAMLALRKRLKQNGVVSITVRDTAENLATVPLLNGYLRVGRGAPYLAHKTGAPLLPVFTVRDEDGCFVTTVEPPLETTGRFDQEGTAARAVLQQYANRLLPYLDRWPGQWLGWSDR